jgi:lysophospholipase L1-like esterase
MAAKDAPRRRRITRLFDGLVLAAAALLAFFLIRTWLGVLAPSWVVLRLAVGVLVALEVAYILAGIAAMCGAVVLGAVVCGARRKRAARPWVARGLLLCLSSLIGMALVEGLAATWPRDTLSASFATRADPVLPTRFEGPAPGGEVNLVVLGESSAVGIPYESWLSVGSIVAWQLGIAMPGRKFRVEMLAHEGDTLARQHAKLAQLRRRPDAVIIYCGHNEFAARWAWSREVDHYVDAVPLTRLRGLAAHVSPFCGWVRETADQYRAGLPPPANTPRPLVDVPAYTPSEYTHCLAEFRRRLETIVAYVEHIGALPILVVPAGNDAGFDPNRSFLPAETPRAEREQFVRDFLEARQLETSDPARAIARYRALLARQPNFAETHYRLALLLERDRAWEEAYQHFLAARDLDGLPFRCLSPFQEAYREVARRHDCLLIDSQALFHALGPHGQIDDYFFHDGMHPSFRGYLVLASAILKGLHARRAFGWPAGKPAPEIDPERCAAHFDLASYDWRPLCERGVMFYRATAPLRYDPRQRLAKQQAFADAARRIAFGEPPEQIGLPNVGIPTMP